MIFDANLGNIGSDTGVEAIVQTAQTADELGFRALWSADHLLPPLNASQFGRVFEPLVSLAFIASITRRIRLGTSVIVLPMRSPFVLAKQVATLDALSNGRVILGIGAGWSAEEFANVHADFRTRGARLDEAILLFRHLWSGSREPFDGRYYGHAGSVFEPLPAQGKELPLLVGGRSEAALKRAARHVSLMLERLHLQLHPGKTRIVQMTEGAEGFDFLGFHHRLQESWRWRGRWFLHKWPSTRAMRAIRQKVKEVLAPRWLLPTSLADRVKAVNPLVRGWGQYFRVGTSTVKFKAIDRYVVQRFAVFLRHKHQWRALGLASSRVHNALAAAGLYRLSGTVRYSGATANARR